MYAHHWAECRPLRTLNPSVLQDASLRPAAGGSDIQVTGAEPRHQISSPLLAPPTADPPKLIGRNLAADIPTTLKRQSLWENLPCTPRRKDGLVTAWNDARCRKGAGGGWRHAHRRQGSGWGGVQPCCWAESGLGDRISTDPGPRSSRWMKAGGHPSRQAVFGSQRQAEQVRPLDPRYHEGHPQRQILLRQRRAFNTNSWLGTY